MTYENGVPAIRTNNSGELYKRILNEAPYELNGSIDDQLWEMYFSVDTIKFQNNICYLTGTYGYLVDNQADYEFHYDFFEVQEDITIETNSNTQYLGEFIKNADDFYTMVNGQLISYANSFVELDLNGHSVTAIRGAFCALLRFWLWKLMIPGEVCYTHEC